MKTQKVLPLPFSFSLLKEFCAVVNAYKGKASTVLDMKYFSPHLHIFFVWYFLGESCGTFFYYSPATLAIRIRKNLGWVRVSSRVIPFFQAMQSTNLQKIEMSRSNFAEIKSDVIFCRKLISQDFWCNYPCIE